MNEAKIYSLKWRFNEDSTVHTTRTSNWEQYVELIKSADEAGITIIENSHHVEGL